MKPSYTPAYRRKEYANRDKKPDVRNWLVCVRFSKIERALLRDYCRKKNKKLGTLLRELALKTSRKFQ